MQPCIHAADCTVTGLPLAWKVETAKDSELPLVPVLLDAAAGRGFTPEVCVLDRDYDAEIIYADVEKRHMRPVIPLRKTPAAKAGKDKPPQVFSSTSGPCFRCASAGLTGCGFMLTLRSWPGLPTR